MQADPFSDILKFTRAESLVTGGFAAGGEPDAVLFETGDVGLLAAKRASVLASALDIEPVDAMGLFSGAGRSTTRCPARNS